MAKELSVLFVTAEVYPYSNETSNADFSYSFPLALRELGHDARVMMPKYGNISERRNRIHEINRLKDLSFDMGGERIIGSIKSSSITNSRNKVQAYVMTNNNYFDTFKGVHQSQKTWEPHPKNIERFIFFSKTVIDTCVLLNWYPNVIHCLGWQTAMIPAYARSQYPKEFKKTNFVVTSDNFLEQGVCKLDKFKLLGLPDNMKTDFTYNKELNLLKGGMVYADRVTTIGKRYGEEVLKNENLSNGLFKKVKDLKKKFSALDSRVDTWTWNPSQDDALASKYEEDLVDFKYHNKVGLVNKFGMEFHPKTPLIAFNIKIDNQQDLKLFIDSADILFKENLQVILLAPGDKELKTELDKIEKKYPDKFKFKLGFSESFNSEIEAGSDMYLITSENPASCPSFMHACLYGSVPIVHNAGIIKDLAENIDEEELEGNAFTYDEYTPKAMMVAVKKALKLFGEKDDWISIARNCMLDDFTWKSTVKEYDSFYRKILKD